MKVLFLSDFTPNKNLVIHQSIELLIEEADYVVFNLEGAVTNESEKLPKQILAFKIEEIVGFCKKYGKEKFVIALANNHIFDNGVSGFNFLIEHLNKESIMFFGTKEKPHITLNNTLSVLNFVTAETVATYKSKPFLNYLFYKEKNIQQQIDDLQETDKQLILYPHWGRDMDKKEFSTYNLKLDSKKWKVFGHHPHVISGVRKNFIYSLGNTFVPHPYYYKNYPAFSYGLAVLYDCDIKDYSLFETKVHSEDDYMKKFLLKAKPFLELKEIVKNHGDNFSQEKKFFLKIFSFNGNLGDYFKLIILQCMIIFFKLKLKIGKNL